MDKIIPWGHIGKPTPPGWGSQRAEGKQDKKGSKGSLPCFPITAHHFVYVPYVITGLVIAQREKKGGGK